MPVGVLKRSLQLLDYGWKARASNLGEGCSSTGLSDRRVEGRNLRGVLVPQIKVKRVLGCSRNNQKSCNRAPATAKIAAKVVILSRRKLKNHGHMTVNTKKSP